MDIGRLIRDLASLALPVFAVAALTTLIVLWAAHRASAPVSRKLILFPVSFAILGGIFGAIAGSSREALVGAIVTGLIGIVSALLSYAFAKEGDSETRATIPPIVILLVLNALAGLSIGENWKRKWDDYATAMAEYRARFNDVWVPVDREYRLSVLRKCIEENRSYTAARDRCSYSALFPG